MKKIIYKLTIFLLTFLFLLPLVGCDAIEDLLDGDIRKNWVTQKIDIDCGRDIYFTYEENPEIKPIVSQVYTNKRGISAWDFLEYSIDKPIEIDTKNPGKYTYTFSIMKHSADNYDEFELIVITKNIYVIEFNFEEGYYYFDNDNGTLFLDYKYENGFIYEYDINTKSFSEETYTFDSIYFYGEESIFYEDEDGTDYDLFSIIMKASEGYTLPMMDFIVKEGVITYRNFVFSKPDEYVQFTSLGNPNASIYSIIKKDNHITQKQIDDIKKFGTLYLDSNKTIEVTPETEIEGNELYIYYDQKDYSDCPFIGDYYYMGEFYFSFEGTKFKMADDSEGFYLNYYAEKTDKGWYIETPFYEFQYNSFWGTLSIYQDGEKFTFKKR